MTSTSVRSPRRRRDALARADAWSNASSTPSRTRSPFEGPRRPRPGRCVVASVFFRLLFFFPLYALLRQAFFPSPPPLSSRLASPPGRRFPSRRSSRLTSPNTSTPRRRFPSLTQPTIDSRPRPGPRAEPSDAFDALWGVSGEAALHLEEGWCHPGVTDFSKCDPRPGSALELPTPRVPDIDDAADLLARGDWENDLDLKPFRLRFMMPPRAVPQATVMDVNIKTKNNKTVTQTFEWYEVRQMLSFMKLFPDNVCAPDPNVCRPCVTAENSAGLENGAPVLDDKSTCVNGQRCLRAGEVPFWWYNGVGPGPLFRVATDLKWRNSLKDAGKQRFVPPAVVVRQANDLPDNCAGGAFTHDELECKHAITSTHHHGSHSLPGFDGWADDVTKSGEWKDYVYAVDMGPRTNWYHGARARVVAFLPARVFFFVFDLKLPSLPRSRAFFSLPPRRPRRSRDSQHRVQRRERSVRDFPDLRSPPVRGRRVRRTNSPSVDRQRLQRLRRRARQPGE